MSARNPLSIYAEQIRGYAHTGYFIRKLTDPLKLREYVKQRLKGEVPEGWWEQVAINYAVDSFLSSKAEMTDMFSVEEDLFGGCDDILLPIKKDGKKAFIALGDVNEATWEQIVQRRKANIEAANRALAKLLQAWTHIQPLLAENPGWVWRDAVNWLNDNGGLPEL